MKPVTQYCTVARIVETNKAVVILQFGEDRCCVKLCRGVNEQSQKEFGVPTSELKEF